MGAYSRVLELRIVIKLHNGLFALGPPSYRAWPRDPSQYDTIVSAEIPDRLNNPGLYNIVKRCMIHGPCGLAKRIAPCMRDGSCSKKYPKEFSSVTTTANDGYPIYRRMDNSRSVELGGCLLDNRWVVPYNPFLLLKYNAHINVEICTTVSAVKYLYKYVYKGHDKNSGLLIMLIIADPSERTKLQTTWKPEASLPLSHAIEYLLMNSMLICRM